MLENTDRPGLDEQYIMATNASDLTVDPDRTRPAWWETAWDPS